MQSRPRVTHEELVRIPLLRGFTDAQLDSIVSLCEPAAPDRDILFREGEPAEEFYLLTKGTVTLSQEGEETHTLYPVAIIGELSALAGRARVTTAVLGANHEVWKIPVDALRRLAADDSALVIQFYQNLSGVVADKVLRDQLRMQDMRANIIHTQKDMKQMREFLLESEDTEVSTRIHEVLEQNIARNRRVNYRVEPPELLASALRLDSGAKANVTQISRTALTIDAEVAARGERVSGVLSSSGPEIPISGVVTRRGDGVTEIELDLLIDEYAQLLEGYLTRIQMLDFIV